MGLLSDLATAALGALTKPRYAVHAIPLRDLDAFLQANPSAKRATRVIAQLEASGDYEAADQLQRAAWQTEQAGCVAVCI